MFIQIAAAALAITAVQPVNSPDPTYDVTDTMVTAAQMQVLQRDASAPVSGEVVSQASIRPSGSDATLRMGENIEGRPFAGTRIDVRTDDTVTFTNNTHGAPVSVVMKVDTTGTARGTYVVGEGRRREHHVVTVKRNG